MEIEINRTVKEVTINATRDGKTVTIQPIISKEIKDNNINGGTP